MKRVATLSALGLLVAGLFAWGEVSNAKDPVSQARRGALHRTAYDQPGVRSSLEQSLGEDMGRPVRIVNLVNTSPRPSHHKLCGLAVTPAHRMIAFTAIDAERPAEIASIHGVDATHLDVAAARGEVIEACGGATQARTLLDEGYSTPAEGLG